MNPNNLVLFTTEDNANIEDETIDVYQRRTYIDIRKMQNTLHRELHK